MSGNSAGDSSNIATNNVLGGQSIGTRGGGGACGRGWLTDYFIESYPAGSHTYYEIRHLVFIGRDISFTKDPSFGIGRTFMK